MTTTSRFVSLRGLRAAVFVSVGAMCAQAQAKFPFEFETSFGYAIAQWPLDSYFNGALACSTPLTVSPRVDVVRGGGAPAHRIARPSGTGLFGVSLAWLPEGEHTLYRLAVGSPDPLAGKGEVFVFNGEAHARITTEVERAVFGASMCVLASKGDRAASLAIGAPRVLDPERPSSGFVLVCDSRTLEVKFTASPAGAGEFFGAYLVEGGDVDRDGRSE